MQRTLNLRQRLTLLLLVATLPGMGVAVALAVNALDERSGQIETTAAHLAALQAAQQTAVVESARIMLDTLTRTNALAEVEEAQCGPVLRDWVLRYPSFTSLTLVDVDGNLVCSSAREAPPDPARQPWFEQVRRAREFTVGQYAVGRAGAPLVIAAQPVLERGGRFAGAAALGIDLRWLEFLARRVELPPDGTVTALAADGSVLVHYVAATPREGGGAANEPAPSQRLREQMVALGKGTIRGENAAGEPRVYGFRRADSGGLVVAVGMPAYLAVASYWAALRDTVAAPLIILVLALAAAWWGSDRVITRGVRALTRTSRQMAEGRFDVRAEVPRSSYEIGELAVAFDSMAQTVEDSDAQLRAAVHARETLLQELNHRVKNNMQMVLSLLRLPARNIEDPQAREQVQDIARRIQTLATVHNLLYRGTRFGPVIEPNYVRQLCDALRGLYAREGGEVDIRITLDEVPLGADQATAFGLILNELVSNAHKHASARGGGGVEITLVREDGNALLSVADDGAGLPEGFDLQASSSTGLHIAQTLALQLGGELSYDRRPTGGAIFHLRFPLKDGNEAGAGATGGERASEEAPA